MFHVFVPGILSKCNDYEFGDFFVFAFARVDFRRDPFASSQICDLKERLCVFGKCFR